VVEIRVDGRDRVLDDAGNLKSGQSPHPDHSGAISPLTGRCRVLEGDRFFIG
jgi:hypothetical protein